MDAVSTVTVLADHERSVDGRIDGAGRALIAPADLPSVLGWTLQPEGLCHGDLCVPVRDRAALEVDGELDLCAIGIVLDRPVLVDADAAVVAFGAPRADRRRALREHAAPPFTLPDLEGNARSLAEWHTKRKLLIAFASW